MAYLYAANQQSTLVFMNLLAAEQVQLVQLVPFTLELTRARIQRRTVSFEAVDVVLGGKVTLQNRSVGLPVREHTSLLRQGDINM